MTSRRAVLAALAAVAVVVGCLDGAVSGVASVSAVQLPMPYVVKGDVMRDSLGVPAKLSVIAYDASGTVVNDTATFVILDARTAHFDGSGFLVGDSISTARVVGSVGGLQTSPTLVTVTVAADTVFVGTIDTLRVTLTNDTTQARIAIPVTVHGAAAAPARSYPVSYTVASALVSAAGKPTTVYIGDDLSKASSVDTTDASGLASRNAVLRIAAVGDTAFLVSHAVRTIGVSVAVKHNGAHVKGSPLAISIPVVVK